MKITIAVAMLAACGGDAKPTAIGNGGTAGGSSTMPPGWVTIEPDEERRRCANYADDEWQIAIERGALRFTEVRDREPDSGPQLPFTPTPQAEVRGRRHVLAVADGFLVGFDAGEWGGALYWFSKDGTKSAKLGDENVHGLIEVGPDVVASVEGLSHLSISEGNIRWIEHAGSWRAGALTALDAGPRTFTATANAIYVVTGDSLVRVDTTDRKATTIQPMSTSLLYPDSMAIDGDGSLWIGMRQFVMRLSPTGTRFTPTWFVRESCVRATVHDLSCVCEAST